MNEGVWHWSVGGAAIGLVVVGLLAFTNRRFGVSGGLDDICASVLRAPYFRRSFGSRRWRLPFLAGLVIGGGLTSAFSGGWSPTWDLGRWDEVVGGSAPDKVVWMFFGGVLIGTGTRMAGGCTSGHGIFGVANMERAAFRTTLAFMATGVVTAHILYGWVLPS